MIKKILKELGKESLIILTSSLLVAMGAMFGVEEFLKSKVFNPALLWTLWIIFFVIVFVLIYYIYSKFTTGSIVIYDGSSTDRIQNLQTDFNGHGSFLYDQNGPIADKGHGAGNLSFNGGVINLYRTNKEGRFEIHLRKYYIPGTVGQFCIPSKSKEKSERIFRITLDSFAHIGFHTLRLVFFNHETNKFLSDSKFQVAGQHWIHETQNLSIPADQPSRFRIDDMDVSEANGFVQIKNLRLEEITEENPKAWIWKIFIAASLSLLLTICGVLISNKIEKRVEPRSSDGQINDTVPPVVKPVKGVSSPSGSQNIGQKSVEILGSCSYLDVLFANNCFYVLAYADVANNDSFRRALDGQVVNKRNIFLFKIAKHCQVIKEKIYSGYVADGAIGNTGNSIIVFYNNLSREATFAFEGITRTYTSNLKLTSEDTVFHESNRGWFPIINGDTLQDFAFSGFHWYINNVEKQHVQTSEAKRLHREHIKIKSNLFWDGDPNKIVATALKLSQWIDS